MLKRTGRGIKQNLSKTQIKERLSADNELMRVKLKQLGYAALLNLLSKPRLSKKQYDAVIGALIKLRNQWLLNGYEDKREVEQEFGKDINALPSKRGYLGHTLTYEKFGGRVPKRDNGE